MTDHGPTPSVDLVLSTPRVRLIVPGPEHYAMIRAAEMSPNLAMRWRHRGRTIGPEEFVARLWEGVVAQYLVCVAGSDRCLGLVATYSLDDRANHAHLAAAKFDPTSRDSTFMEGLALFIENTFASWPIRKLYLDVPEFNVDTFGSAIGSLLVEEGRLKDHDYAAGRFWDHLVLALYRDTWNEQTADLLPLLTRGSSTGPAPE